MAENRRKSENIRRANRVIQTRTFVLMLVLGVAVFLVLALKLYQLQIKQHDYYQSKALDQQTRSTVVTASRGTIYDRNGNGRWDTGDYDKGLQPEEVYYFPQAIDVRTNWDIEQTWRVKELPLTQQKPRELIKQKEAPKKSPRSRNAERARQLGRR